MIESQFCLCRKTVLSFLFVLICLPVAGLAQSAEQNKEEDNTMQNIAFKDASLKAALATLGKQLKLDVVFDDNIKNTRLSIEFQDVRIRAAMECILFQQHLQARLMEDKTIIIYSDNEASRERYAKFTSWYDGKFVGSYCGQK